MGRPLVAVFLACAASSCAPSVEPRPPGAAPGASADEPGPVPAEASPAIAPEKRAADGAPPKETAAPAAPARVPFPPPPVEPPSSKSAAEGDGRWTAVGDAALGERTGGDPPMVVRTVVHPHPESRFITITVAAVDLTRATLRLAPGTEDLAWAKLPVGPSSGLVPEADRDALLFVMNGGFQPKHGRFGLVADGVVIAPPREGACTLAIDAGGAVSIDDWAALAPAAASFRTLRQTPPCLVSGGALHPSLRAGRDKAWKGQIADLKTRRRSAVGIDASGHILFYGIGEEADARWLAEGMRLAGAHAAAQLDINWYWTRFLVTGAVDGKRRVTSTLIPKMEYQKTGYVERPSTRDFFYAVAR